MTALQEWMILGITLDKWLYASLAAVLGYVIMDAVTRFITRRLKGLSTRTSTRTDDIVCAALASTKRFLLFLLALLVGLEMLDLPIKLAAWLSHAWAIVIGLQVAIWLNHAVNAWSSQAIDPLDADLRKRAMTTTMAFLIRAVLMVLVVLTVLANMGVNITAFVASLGIGGVAVALALQTVLSDLFASLSIGMDKPFEVGDFIVVDDLQGTVEYIGVKTTRLRSLSGEQLIRSNAELLKSAIRNYKRMSERRVVFKFGITYETPVEQIGTLGDTIRQIITGIAHTRFDRAHFVSFGDSSLDFEVVYYVLSTSYNEYMDIQQRINLELMTICAEREIAFAYPTTTLHVASKLQFAECTAPEPADDTSPATVTPATSN